MRYKKKASLVDAVQYTGHNGAFLRDWSKGAVVESPVLEPTADNPTGAYIQVRTLQGTMPAGVGCWIVLGHEVPGEFMPMPAAEFEATYERAE